MTDWKNKLLAFLHDPPFGVTPLRGSNIIIPHFAIAERPWTSENRDKPENGFTLTP